MSATRVPTVGSVSGNTPSGSGNIDDTVNMTAGSSVTYTLTGVVHPSATGTLANTASVSLLARLLRHQHREQCSDGC